MTILLPKEIPGEPGMIAVRVTVPVTPREREWAMNSNSHPLWRVTLWYGSRVWFTNLESAEPPTLDCIFLHQCADSTAWVEIMRSPSV
jgi:hypothetical protein